MSVRRFPSLIHPRRDARNGMYPSTDFYNKATYAENHLTAYAKKVVFQWSGLLGDTKIGATGGTVAHSRFRFHAGYGATKLLAYARLARDTGHGATDPYVSIDVTEVGGATTSMLPDMHFGASANAGIDAPDDVVSLRSSLDITPNTTYEVLVNQIDFCRIASLMFIETGTGVIDEATDYYNVMRPQSGLKIYDSHRGRLLPGLSNMWRRNGGLQINWGQEGGATRTRTSATPINLVDNSTTGTPTANTPGWTLDLAYRTTYSRAVVPCVLAVYASIAAGSGTVRVTDTTPASPISVTVNNATPQWFTATGNLIASAGKKYDPMFYSDGANSLIVYALSLYEYEA